MCAVAVVQEVLKTNTMPVVVAPEHQEDTQVQARPAEAQAPAIPDILQADQDRAVAALILAAVDPAQEAAPTLVAEVAHAAQQLHLPAAVAAEDLQAIRPADLVMMLSLHAQAAEVVPATRQAVVAAGGGAIPPAHQEAVAVALILQVVLAEAAAVHTRQVLRAVVAEVLPPPQAALLAAEAVAIRQAHQAAVVAEVLILPAAPQVAVVAEVLTLPAAHRVAAVAVAPTRPAVLLAAEAVAA